MTCFLWGIGIILGLFVLGYIISLFSDANVKRRRTYLESANFDEVELRNRAELFLKKQKIEETSGVLAQKERSFSIDLDKSLDLYDLSMKETPHDHHLACLICDYLFYMRAMALFEGLNTLDRGILNTINSSHTTNVFYARSRAIYRLSKLGLVEIGKGRATAREGWLRYWSTIEAFHVLLFDHYGSLQDICEHEWDAFEGMSMTWSAWDDSEDLYDRESDQWKDFWDEDQLWSHTHI